MKQFQDVTTVFVYFIFVPSFFILWTNHSQYFDSIPIHIRTWSTFDCANITQKTILHFKLSILQKRKETRFHTKKEERKQSRRYSIIFMKSNNWNHSKENRISFFSFLLNIDTLVLFKNDIDLNQVLSKRSYFFSLLNDFYLRKKHFKTIGNLTTHENNKLLYFIWNNP